MAWAGRQNTDQKKRRKAQPEAALQASLVKDLAMVLGRDTFFFAVPNGGKRNRTEAAIFAGQGVVPGMTDLVVFHGGRAFCMELKAPKGTTSTKQDDCHERIERAGVPVAIVRCLRDALDFLHAWKIPTRIIGATP